jgi:hypothetical protein
MKPIQIVPCRTLTPRRSARRTALGLQKKHQRLYRLVSAQDADQARLESGKLPWLGMLAQRHTWQPDSRTGRAPNACARARLPFQLLPSRCELSPTPRKPTRLRTHAACGARAVRTCTSQPGSLVAAAGSSPQRHPHHTSASAAILTDDGVQLREVDDDPHEVAAREGQDGARAQQAVRPSRRASQLVHSSHVRLPVRTPGWGPWAPRSMRRCRRRRRR